MQVVIDINIKPSQTQRNYTDNYKLWRRVGKYLRSYQLGDLRNWHLSINLALRMSRIFRE